MSRREWLVLMDLGLPQSDAMHSGTISAPNCSHLRATNVDMSVPAHAHLSPHGGKTFDDPWGRALDHSKGEVALQFLKSIKHKGPKDIVFLGAKFDG